MVNITRVNLLTLAASIPYASQLASLTSLANNTVQLVSYDSSFETDILGNNVSVRLLSSQPYPAFHEAGVYIKETNSMYIASNFQQLVDPPVPINVTILNLSDYSITSANFSYLVAANGACAFPTGNKTYLLFCDEGDATNPSSLIQIDVALNTSRRILTSFLGRNFSSINDVKWHPETGDLWFTDAQYGYFQGFRQTPSIPEMVYRFEPKTGVVQAVADGFVQANGIEFSPDLKNVYITDTGQLQYITSTPLNYTLPASIYVYDITADKSSLQNRRLFAYSDNGIPDGIHTDTKGNVYAGCGDGVHVWNSKGILIGKFVVNGGAANFAFVPGGLLIFNVDKLYLVSLTAKGRTIDADFS